MVFVNKLTLIFNKLEIDTFNAIEAVGTKWILPFRPGLVGGHCIGGDPYYLVYKVKEIVYYSENLAARK